MGVFGRVLLLSILPMVSVGGVAQMRQDAPGLQSMASIDAVEQAIGVAPALAQLRGLRSAGKTGSEQALLLREQVMERVLIASFEVDDTLGRIDAEAAHANEIRSVVQAQREHRQAVLNVATFAVSGALGAAGSAMELTRNLNHAGNALQLAGSASAVGLSTAQLVGGQGGRHLFRSPYNMLAQILGQTPNSSSRYPAVVAAYLHTATAEDGQPTDNVAPENSLRNAWYRLHRLQQGGGKNGSTLASTTSDPSEGQKLTEQELMDREAMLRDLHGAVALLKVQMRGILLAQSQSSAEQPAAKP